MTVRYRCTNDKTPHSFNGYDTGLMQQLPKIYAKEFPAILTESSGISTKLAKLMRPLFQSGVGSQRLSKVSRVMHTEHSDELQFLYCNKMVEKLQNSTMIDFLRIKRDGASVSYDDFSSFEFVPFLDQLTSITDGVILKGDHSFKIIKHMGKTNGTSVFSSLYTVMNEYEEIRMQVLAHTKSFKELSGRLGPMMESYRRYGFDMPQAYIPSLSDNVRAIVIDKSTGNANLSNKDQFPPAVLPQSMAIEIRDTASEIFVGFDCEWFKIYHEESNTVFLFRIFGFDRNTFPGKLKEIIASKRIREIGKNVGGDLTRLKRYVSETNGELELGTYCFNRNAISSSRKSLSDICNVILKIHLPKSNDVRLSNWEALDLSDQQKRYAALDAYVAIAVCNSFVKVKRPGLILEKYKASNSDSEDRSVTLEMFGEVPFLAYVEYKCLRTASESIDLRDIHSETLSESTVPANISFSSSNVPVRLDEHKSTSEKATVPSRVLKDVFI
ncbi:hypothetical protein INT47_007396 [Mucor saturninus]|uniref:3'-5' exonuclease n=1 Tax=Mucor saturninus TaxID=64648 RepID=A0A8H7QJA9_9FUNG|nr:hypothetical protein INT47_007396 [Mucor saturninus]